MPTAESTATAVPEWDYMIRFKDPDPMEDPERTGKEKLPGGKETTGREPGKTREDYGKER